MLDEACQHAEASEKALEVETKASEIREKALQKELAELKQQESKGSSHRKQAKMTQ